MSFWQSRLSASRSRTSSATSTRDRCRTSCRACRRLSSTSAGRRMRSSTSATACRTRAHRKRRPPHASTSASGFPYRSRRTLSARRGRARQCTCRFRAGTSCSCRRPPTSAFRGASRARLSVRGFGRSPRASAQRAWDSSSARRRTGRRRRVSRRTSTASCASGKPCRRRTRWRRRRRSSTATPTSSCASCATPSQKRLMRSTLTTLRRGAA